MINQPTSFKTYLIICEGVSEERYLTKLNSILRKLKIVFKPVYAGGGEFTNLIKKYKTKKEEEKKNKITDFIIWADYDRYLRNDNKNNDEYIKSEYKDIFKFSYLNFEDFLIMHKKKDSVLNWQKIMEEENHFETPIYSNRLQHLIEKNKIFNNYKKGKIPIELNDESFDNLRKNYSEEDIKFKGDNDFIDFLLENIIPHHR